MSERKNLSLTILLVLSVSLLTSTLTAFILHTYYSKAQFNMLGHFSRELMEKQPEVIPSILEILKEEKGSTAELMEENILYHFGYQQLDFIKNKQNYSILLTGIGFAAGSILFLLAFWYCHKKEVLRIKVLTDYLEKINTGGAGLLLQTEEDDYSRLQDEIYKTVTTLYQTRDAALKAKHNFADNLFNIAHQLKTPITAISLSTQMMKEQPSPKYPVQIQKQLKRLTHLEEALLLLSRIDAGTLTMRPSAVDVFTVLTLASDNLQELFVQSEVKADIPEMGEVEITVDLDWTMEAIMNLLKNCMEHSSAGATVHCSYEKNPLYVQIKIWDEGQGFAKEDLPHLFERFYQGKNPREGGIGIGLSLSKAIIEMQNGIISAVNLPAGGACFDIRMYSH